MAHIQRRTRDDRLRFVARYLDPDGGERSKSFDTEPEAERFLIRMEASKLNGTYLDPAAARLTFDQWTDQWWRVWASDPDRSPTTLAAADSRLRHHLRPKFGRRRLGEIRPSLVQEWQHELRARLDHSTILACRSLLNRILQAAEDERLIPANPVAKVRRPKRPVDPETILTVAKARVLTPDQLGLLLGAAGMVERDRLLIVAGTGLRAGELCGLRSGRIDVARRRLAVATVRYDAGKWGRGYKGRPKSVAGIRVVPLASQVLDAIGRQFAAGSTADLFLFPDATRYQLRRDYLRAVAGARRQGHLHGLDLRGPHDLRHTFATWLEDEAVPARVIDELMGHAPSRASAFAVDAASPMGAVYRHTTPAMEARVITAVEGRLGKTLKVAERAGPTGRRRDGDGTAASAGAS
jgi:integrase